MSPPRPTFLADAMLGDLARWLRILGEDCLYADPEWDDAVVLEAARGDDRVLVTRDKALVARAKRQALRAVCVPQASPVEMLAVVYRALGRAPDAARTATRCSLCNGRLVETDGAGAATHAEAKGRTPPHEAVRARHERFWSCRACGQPFWRGTHWEEIERTRDALAARLART